MPDFNPDHKAVYQSPVLLSKLSFSFHQPEIFPDQIPALTFHSLSPNIFDIKNVALKEETVYECN